MRRTFACLVVAFVLLAACESDQDPRIDVDGDAPAQTSDTLGPCPPGGPDQDTPPAGCLDEDGQVVRP